MFNFSWGVCSKFESNRKPAWRNTPALLHFTASNECRKGEELFLGGAPHKTHEFAFLDQQNNQRARGSLSVLFVFALMPGPII